MSIYDTYAQYVMEGILRDEILGGSPSYRDVVVAFDTYLLTHDLKTPAFVASNYEVGELDSSSAASYNQAMDLAAQDMRVLFKHLLLTESTMSRFFSRWRAEAERLEGRLKDLEERVSDLLLVTKDTEGYFNYVYDALSDASKINTSSSCLFDKKRGLVTLGASSLTPTRLDLTNAVGAVAVNSVEFTVLSQNNMVSATEAAGSKLQYVISDATNYWQQNVVMSKPGTVTAEIVVSFSAAKTFSRILVDLHAANQNSKVSVTPFTSNDKYNWTQLPITNFSREITDRASFQFSSLSAKYVKFIITKPGYDRVDNSQYVYEFGVDEVAFFADSFGTSDLSQTFYSTALSVLDKTGTATGFSKAVLEVCENVPTGTTLAYSLAVSNSSTTALGSLTFMNITPVNRTSYKEQTILDFGELPLVTIADVAPSYDSSGAA